MRAIAILACAALGALTAIQPALAQQGTEEEIQALTAPASSRGGSTVTGLSNASNPAISVNGLILGAGSDEGPAHFGLQEFELQFSSDIDPYFRADITFAIHEEFDVPGLAHGHEGEEEEEEEHGGIEVEQAMISSLAIPNMTLRFGKFLLPFGKHNILHTHAFPFITKPAVISETFGEEGLNEMAIDVAPLLPLPFFSELNVAALQGGNELFHGAGEEGPDSAKFLVHSKNLFDVTDDATVEAGLSYLAGGNDTGEGRQTTAQGLDLTFKQRPQTGRGLSAFVVQGEWIGATRETNGGDLESSGYYASVQWRVLDYWWVQGRAGTVTIDEVEDGAIAEEESNHTDLLIGWVPTEFSALRLQYSQIEHGEDKANAWFLQYNFAIGSHPAHQY